MNAQRRRKSAAIVFLALVLFIGGALVALAYFDWNHARGWVARKVQERTGRELGIAGNLEVHPFSFYPQVRAERVTFANSDWGEKRPMLDAEAVEFSFGLLALLFRGNLVIPELSLSGADVLLQRAQDGRRNWILKAPEDTAEGPSPQVLQLAVEKSRLRVKDVISDTDVKLDIQSKAGDAVYATDLAADGRVRGVPLKMKGASGGLLRLMDEHTPYPIRVEGTLGDARASARGTLTGTFGNADLDAEMKLSGGNLAPLGDVLKISLPHTKPYQLSGKLERRAALWKFSRFSGVVGKSDLGGDFSVDTAGERPVLTAALSSKSLDVADLGGFIGMHPGNAPASKAPGKVLPSEAINLEKLRRIDAHVRLVAAHVQDTTAVPLDNLDAKLNLVDGVFKLEPIVFGMADGSLNSTVVVDARQPRLATSLDSAFRNLHLNKLIPGTAKLDAAIGAVDGRVKLKGTGNSIAGMLGSSSGRVDLYSEGGKVSNLLLEFAGADVAEIVKFWIGGDRQVQLRCAVASFKVDNGVAASETLVVDTDDTIIGGTGNVSLAAETFDLTLTPLPKDFSILAFRGPLRVTSSFAEPKFGLEKMALARKVGAAVLLGLVNPLAAFLPLIETGPGKNAPCAQLLGTVEAAAKGGKSAPATAAAAVVKRGG